VSNFDSQFTGGSAEPGAAGAAGASSVTGTPVDKLLLMNVDAEQFADFNYVNPEFVVVV